MDGEETFLFLSNRQDLKTNPELWRERQRCANHYPMSVAHPAHTSHRPNVGPSSTTSAQHWFNVSWLLGSHTPSLFINTTVCVIMFAPFTAGAAYIRVFIFYQHIRYNLLNMLNIECDINQHDLKKS